MPRRKSTSPNSSYAGAIELSTVSGEVVEAELVEPAHQDPEQIRQQAIADAESDFNRFYLPAYQWRMRELIDQHRAASIGVDDVMDVINSMPFTQYD